MNPLLLVNMFVLCSPVPGQQAPVLARRISLGTLTETFSPLERHPPRSKPSQICTLADRLGDLAGSSSDLGYGSHLGPLNRPLSHQEGMKKAQEKGLNKLESWLARCAIMEHSYWFPEIDQCVHFGGRQTSPNTYFSRPCR